MYINIYQSKYEEHDAFLAGDAYNLLVVVVVVVVIVVSITSEHLALICGGILSDIKSDEL